ncbi:MAG: ParA family protein [Bradyrhizobium sp.]|nr:MAG: ParA family protein [Bradyrhizobium sp.]
MQIVSVINYKGGVGKTSLTANLAAELAFRGKKVLLVDLDAQASLTFSMISPDEWQQKYSENQTIKSWFDSFESGAPLSLKSIVHSPTRVNSRLRQAGGKVDAIYSHLGLINVDLELATNLGGATLAQAKKNFTTVHRRLLKGLNEFGDNDYDLVLIDCPPNFNIVTKTAIVASNFLLVPARPDYLSTLGIEYLIRSVSALVKDYNDFAELNQGEKVDPIKPKLLGVVFTMIQEYGGGPMAAQRAFMGQHQTAGLTVFDKYIKRNDTLFADAPQYGVPVVLNSYASGSHQSVVEGIEGVATEFGRHMNWWM